jgi:plasmid stability protein
MAQRYAAFAQALQNLDNEISASLPILAARHSDSAGAPSGSLATACALR